MTIEVGQPETGSENPNGQPIMVDGKVVYEKTGEVIQQADSTAAGEQGTGSETPSPADERPEWLPEQFKTVEDLAKSYNELRSAFDRRNSTAEEAQNKPAASQTAESAEQAQETVESAGLDWTALTNEYAENGELSGDTYGALAAKGIDRNTVDSYISGQESLAREFEQEVFGIAGGEENYRSAVDWAEGQWTDQDIAEFNEALDSNNAMVRTLAIENLVAGFQQNRGVEPQLVGGSTAEAGRSAGFRSINEQTQMQGDPRYRRGDPDFIAEFERRLMATTAY